MNRTLARFVPNRPPERHQRVKLPMPGDYLICWRSKPEDLETPLRFITVNDYTPHLAMCMAKDILKIKDKHIVQVFDKVSGRIVHGKKAVWFQEEAA